MRSKTLASILILFGSSAAIAQVATTQPTDPVTNNVVANETLDDPAPEPTAPGDTTAPSPADPSGDTTPADTAPTAPAPGEAEDAPPER